MVLALWTQQVTDDFGTAAIWILQVLRTVFKASPINFHLKDYSMVAIQLRRMREDDLPDLTLGVSKNYGLRFAEQFVVEATCAFMPYPFRPHFTVAEIEGRIVGCGCWASDWISWGVFNVSWVQVSPNMQSRGIGRAIMGRILDELRPQANLVMLATQIPTYYSRHWNFQELHKYAAGEDEEYMLMSLILNR